MDLLGGLVFSYDIVGTVRSFPHLLPPHQPNDQFESTLVGKFGLTGTVDTTEPFSTVSSVFLPGMSQIQGK